MIDKFFSEKNNIVLAIAVLFINTALILLFKYNLFTLVLFIANFISLYFYLRNDFDFVKYTIFLSLCLIFWQLISYREELNYLYILFIAISGALVVYFFSKNIDFVYKIIYSLVIFIGIYEVSLILSNNYNTILNSAMALVFFYIAEGLVSLKITNNLNKIEIFKYSIVFTILFSILIIKY